MDLEQWNRVRHRVLVKKESKRSVMASEGLHYVTLQRMLEHSFPPGYKRRECTFERKIDPHLEWIGAVLERDKTVPKKQRHTAKRIFDRLKGERGYVGGYTIVKEVVRELGKKNQEVFFPIEHKPGEAQVDFGHALFCVNGKLGKYPFFVMALPYSDVFFAQVFHRECTETFQEGHVRAFNYWGKVPHRISYDNSKIAVSKIIGTRTRKLTDGFLTLQSHYLFEEHFCRVARGNEKGVVEAMVGYFRRNFLVPVPQISDLETFNEQLKVDFELQLQHQVRGKSKRKGERFQEEWDQMRALPKGGFDACKLLSTRGSSLSLVRFDGNDYSVPTRYAHKRLLVKGYSDRIAICNDHGVIAEHPRLWDSQKVQYEPRHYLALLERKPGAIDFARPLMHWDLPECFCVLRQKLESKSGHEGTRQYIKVLRLLEEHAVESLRQAIAIALQNQALDYEVIKQHLYSDPDSERFCKFSLVGRPRLEKVKVQTPNISNYNSLLKPLREPF